MVHGAYIFSYDFSIYSAGIAWMKRYGRSIWTDQSLHPILEMAIEGNRLLRLIMQMHIRILRTSQRRNALMQCLHDLRICILDFFFF